MGGAASVLLGTRGKTWACDYKGQERRDPSGRGRGALPHPPLQPASAGRAAPARARSARRRPERAGTSPERPTDHAAGVPSQLPVLPRGQLRPPRDRNFIRAALTTKSHVKRSGPGQPFSPHSPAPPAQLQGKKKKLICSAPPHEKQNDAVHYLAIQTKSTFSNLLSVRTA